MPARPWSAGQDLVPPHDAERSGGVRRAGTARASRLHRPFQSLACNVCARCTRLVGRAGVPVHAFRDGHSCPSTRLVGRALLPVHASCRTGTLARPRVSGRAGVPVLLACGHRPCQAVATLVLRPRRRSTQSVSSCHRCWPTDSRGRSATWARRPAGTRRLCAASRGMIPVKRGERSW